MQETLGHMNTWTIYLLLLVITIFAAYFCIAVAGFLQKLKLSMTKKKNGKSSMGCLTLLILVTAGLFLFVVFRYLVLYAPFSTDEPIAKITAQQADDHLGDFKLAVVFIEKGEPTHSGNYVIKGQRWLIKGEILQWHRWLSAFGLKKMYRTTHVLGQLVTKTNAGARANSYTLIKDDQNALWRTLSSACKALGLVRVKSICSEAVAPNYRETVSVWISDSGLKVRLNNVQADAHGVKNGGNKKNGAHETGDAVKKTQSNGYPDREEAIQR
ncbi:MAG: hypothetical protein BWY83_02390 [bacterium ADurb.Bin478]|nr:MAG: hypothetical protein BWY83_02390 [bacterium ADurb.Bin478]